MKLRDDIVNATVTEPTLKTIWKPTHAGPLLGANLRLQFHGSANLLA